MNPIKRTKSKITLETKRKVIQAAEMNVNVTELSKQFKIPRASIYGILKAKIMIKSAIDSGNGMKQCRIKSAKHANLEKAILTWFKQSRSQNIPISGQILQEKAKELAIKLEIFDFTASNGWLEKFRLRHSIIFKSIQGEANSVKLEELNVWQEQVLQEVLSKYLPVDVFNVDETGLFWRLLPNNTLSFKGERCIGGKKSKERITVLIGANVTGTEKLPLLVIGKSAKPRCFKNARPPVKYLSNSNAWMTACIFESWLKEWNAKLKQKKRKVLLFVDNCTAHMSTIQLTNIELKFFLSNTTAIAQPMDQGVIQNLKVHYKRLLLRRKIDAIDTEKTFNFNLLDALFLLQRSWDIVTTETIKNCFGKAKFMITKEISEEPINEELNLLWDSLNKMESINENIKLIDYITVDETLVTNGIMSLNDIAKSVCEKSSDYNNLDFELVPAEEVPPVSYKEAREALDIVRSYMERNTTDQRILNVCHELDDELVKQRSKVLKQSSLFDFKIKR